MSYFSNVGFKDTANFDAFSRLRVSNSFTSFDAQFTYGLQPLLYNNIVTGTGASITHDTTNRCALFTFSSTPTGGQTELQTFEHFRYIAGKSQLVFMTFNMNGGIADVIKYAGYTDGTEGIQFRLNGITPEICILSTTGQGNNIVANTSWNVDKFDGLGPSGITLDFTQVQILVIDFQALYVGRVRVGFDVDGQIFWAHYFLNANDTITPYFKTANLPLRAGMTCTATVSTTMRYICASVKSEGGDGENSEGYNFTQSSSVTAGSGVRTHALSLQPRLTFNSIINRGKFEIEDFNIVVTGSAPVQWELCIGDAITGTTTFTDVNTNYSIMSYNTAGTTSGTPLIVISSGYVAASTQSKGSATATTPFKYPITLDYLGAARILGRLTLLVTGIGAASACQVSINWKEIR